MEFRKSKFKIYDAQNILKNKTIRVYYMKFNTERASNIVSLQSPASDYEKNWTILPTLIYHHDISVVPGPNFTLKFRWLKWDILTFIWARVWNDAKCEPYEEETAESQQGKPVTFLDQEDWGFTEENS